jgi:NAD(P)-dependent dehydrogenase (short-subunit alcohol dehydrogenase family)
VGPTNSEGTNVSAVRNKVIVVTGGTGSLGIGVVSELVSAGATVVATAHRPTPAPVEGVDVEVVDLSNAAAAAPMFERVLARHGRVDGLVCLVGGFRGGSFIQTDNATWRELVDLNLHTAANVIRAALPGMLERRYGRIVTVGSRPALDPAPNTSAYAAAKAAVIALTRSLGRELRGSGVTINCVIPSTIDTPQNREAMPRADPAKWVKPAEIGRVIAFLCSDAAGIIRGAELPVYGDA